MPLDTHKQGYAPSSWACRLNGRVSFILYLLLCVGQSRVQSQALLVIAPAILKRIALGSITLWKEKSIFRALKAFLFFCGVGWEREDVWLLLAFLSVQRLFSFPLPFYFFPLIGCTDPTQERKRFSLLMLLPMLLQSHSYL